MYSVETLLYSCILLFTYPAYRYLRNTNLLILPHPNYLKTFQLNHLNTGHNNSIKKYLIEKFKLLEIYEQKVSLLLDEIYVKPAIIYKANKLQGFAKNCSDIEKTSATTVQVFMISSVLSKNKDVVGLFPVRNLESNYLHSITNSILQLLNEIGFEVVAILNDNNKVNRSLFEKLSGGVMKIYIDSPFDKNKNFFLLFDTVHLLKCIRNNLLNATDQTFIFPSFSDKNIIQNCKVKHLEIIHEHEKLNIVKHATSLNNKVLYPTSLERQNVYLACQFFDGKTIESLNYYKDLLDVDYIGTKEFLQIINNWWTIVNVQHPDKG